MKGLLVILAICAVANVNVNVQASKISGYKAKEAAKEAGKALLKEKMFKVVIENCNISIQDVVNLAELGRVSKEEMEAALRARAEESLNPETLERLGKLTKEDVVEALREQGEELRERIATFGEEHPVDPETLERLAASASKHEYGDKLRKMLSLKLKGSVMKNTAKMMCRTVLLYLGHELSERLEGMCNVKSSGMQSLLTGQTDFCSIDGGMDQAQVEELHDVWHCLSLHEENWCKYRSLAITLKTLENKARFSDCNTFYTGVEQLRANNVSHEAMSDDHHEALRAAIKADMNCVRDVIKSAVGPVDNDWDCFLDAINEADRDYDELALVEQDWPSAGLMTKVLFDMHKQLLLPFSRLHDKLEMLSEA